MIYYFSGTGNTRHVAELLAKHLGSDIHQFSTEELRSPHKAKLTSADTLIIWAFPTYSWGVPPVIRQIISNAELDFPKEALHLAVVTCGDDIGMLPSMFRREITARGLLAGAVFSVTMPNTYVMMKGFDTDSTQIARQKIDNSSKRVEEIAVKIDKGECQADNDMVVKGSFARLKTTLIYPFFTRFEMSPKGFSVDKGKCIHCGKCEKICPMANINLEADGCPTWGTKCAFCTACYHVCPMHAIDWKNTCVKKGQVKYFNQ